MVPPIALRNPAKRLEQSISTLKTHGPMMYRTQLGTWPRDVNRFEFSQDGTGGRWEAGEAVKPGERVRRADHESTCPSHPAGKTHQMHTARRGNERRRRRGHLGTNGGDWRRRAQARYLPRGAYGREECARGRRGRGRGLEDRRRKKHGSLRKQPQLPMNHHP